MRITTYLHSDKMTMLNLGMKNGLKGAALDFFMYALYEVKIEMDVNEETGEATIIKVDDKELKNDIK